MSIEQQRVIISRFMGLEGTDDFLALNYMYEQSWKLLMPVGEKIFNWLQAEVKKRPSHTCTEGDLIEVDITCAIREYDRIGAFTHMVRWIEWYNTQTTSTI